MTISRWKRVTMSAVLAVGVAVGSLAAATPAQAQGGFKGKVIAKNGLVVRTAPSTHAGSAGSVAQGTTISIDCKVTGTRVDGNTLWYELSNGNGWVSARYVDNIGAAPDRCPAEATEYGVGQTTTGLTMRTGPTTADTVQGALPSGTKVNVTCYVNSQNVGGERQWYLLDNGSWVSAAYVTRIPAEPSNWVPCT